MSQQLQRIRNKLTLDKAGGWLGGVCAGFARFCNIEPIYVRGGVVIVGVFIPEDRDRGLRAPVAAALPAQAGGQRGLDPASAFVRPSPALQFDELPVGAPRASPSIRRDCRCRERDPPPGTRSASALRMVDRRCAITTTSRSAAASWSDATSWFSVCGSSAAVGSSRIRMLASRTRPRAMDSRCLLADGQGVAGAPEYGVDAVRQFVDEVHAAGGLEGGHHPLLAGF